MRYGLQMVSSESTWLGKISPYLNFFDKWGLLRRHHDDIVHRDRHRRLRGESEGPQIENILTDARQHGQEDIDEDGTPRMQLLHGTEIKNLEAPGTWHHPMDEDQDAHGSQPHWMMEDRQGQER